MSLDLASFLSSWLQSGAMIGISPDEVFIAHGAARSGTQGQFYAPDFFLTTSTPWISFEHSGKVQRVELLAALKAHLKAKPERLKWSAEAAPRFERLFSELQHEFKAGSLQKAVPYTFEQAECRMEGDRLVSALIETLEYAATSTAVTPYGLWSADEGILGCTPETLFRQDERGVHTMAVAGTRRGDDAGMPSLLDDPKERREHQLVIDAIVGELTAMGEVKAHPTAVMKLRQLSHLKTPIDLLPRLSVTFADLVQALHPTPALGAFPRARGWDWLREVENEIPVKRLRYGAPFGATWINTEKNARGEQESLCVVAIRNVQWRGSRLLLCAGCGLIAESQVDREWLELRSKMNAIKDIVGM